MQPRFVVPEQPRDGFIISMAPGREALPLQALRKGHSNHAERIDDMQAVQCRLSDFHVPP